MPRAVLPLIALLAGVVSALGFAPLDWWPLTLAGVAVLVALTLDARTIRGAALVGWLFGVGQFVVSLNWIATAFTYQAAMPAFMGWVTVVLLSMFLALYPGIAAACARAWPGGRISRVLVFAAAWMLTEWLRGHVLSGFAWDPLGIAWLSAGEVSAAAAWIGGLGLSGLMALAAGAVAIDLRRRRLTAFATFGTVIGLAILTAVFAPTIAPASGPMLHIVQPNIGQGERWDPTVEDAHVRRQLAMTRAVLAPGHDPAIILWSESSVQGLAEEDASLRARLASVLASRDILLFGGISVARDSAGNATTAHNSLFALDATGRILARYDKAHLVPLGEYVPAHDLMTKLGLARLSPGNLGFIPGPGPQTLTLPGLPDVGVQICYEMIFPGEVVEPGHRPAWLVQPSNDSWYGDWMQPQHVDQARLRAIEEGLAIARVTPTGTSAIIDAHGRVVASIGPHLMSTLSQRLPPPLPPTLFARFAHWTSFAFGLTLLAAAVALRRRI
jgi:apolipoprotein N-acyltransferase